MMIPSISPGARNTVLFATLILGLVVCTGTAWYSISSNGQAGFPLDDPWIHLQFAKNLNEFGSFSYFRDEMVTSGSTSPLYTMLLAAGFFVSSQEMILSYVLGIGFFLAALFFMSRLASLEFNDAPLIAVAAAGLLAMEPRLIWGALSGMETTLFTALALSTLYFYKTRASVASGVAGGLLVWARPEAVLFLGILLLDAVYHARFVKRAPVRGKRVETVSSVSRLQQGLFIAAGLSAAYVAFNMLLSGSPLPNTFAAKITYYSGGGRDFPAQVWGFMSHGHMRVLSLFAVLGGLAAIVAVVQRKATGMLVHLLWPLLMFLVYWQKLPYLYQEGRYLMPVLPSVILLGLHGVHRTAGFLHSRIGVFQRPVAAYALQISLPVLFLVQFGLAGWGMKAGYAGQCKYISDRQVRTATWLRENLPPDAVVGTHDVGAIGFYSGRRVVDMVGLVSPEMIGNIGSYSKLRQFLVDQGVTHLAVLRNWFGIDNVEALFRTNEETPEIMEVFPFVPGRVHFLSSDLYMPMQMAELYLKQGNLQQAGPVLEEVVRRDPQSSRGHLLLGIAHSMSGRIETAGEHLRTAVRLNPDNADARIAEAQLIARLGRPGDAAARLEQLRAERPEYVPTYRALVDVHRMLGSDSALVNQYVLRSQQPAAAQPGHP